MLPPASCIPIPSPFFFTWLHPSLRLYNPTTQSTLITLSFSLKIHYNCCISPTLLHMLLSSTSTSIIITTSCNTHTISNFNTIHHYHLCLLSLSHTTNTIIHTHTHTPISKVIHSCRSLSLSLSFLVPHTLHLLFPPSPSPYSLTKKMPTSTSILLFFLTCATFPLSSTPTTLNHRTLHQPFFPQDSILPSQPPNTTPKLPFSTTPTAILRPITFLPIIPLFTTAITSPHSPPTYPPSPSTHPPNPNLSPPTSSPLLSPQFLPLLPSSLSSSFCWKKWCHHHFETIIKVGPITHFGWARASMCTPIWGLYNGRSNDYNH